MRRQSLLGTAAAAAAALAFVAATAHADDRAAARPLFEEGRRLMKEGKVAEACAKFESASHLTQTPGVRLNLAGCWVKLGRTASAWGMYDEARAFAERTGDVASAELAQKGKAELEPKLSRLVVTVADANTAGLAVTRDGEPVFSGAWGVGVPVDPGQHQVAAHAPGRKAWSGNVNVTGEGSSVTIAVPVLDAEPVASPTQAQVVAPPQPAPDTTATEPSEPPARKTSTRAIVGLGVAGVGVILTGVGAVFGAQALSKNSESNANGDCTGNLCNATGFSARTTARSNGDISSVFIGVGAAAIAGGVVLWLTAPKSGTLASAHHLMVGVGPTGLDVKGVF